MSKPTEQETAIKVERRVERRLREAIATYGLLDDGDRVLVGVSGGKDSLCLLELLARRMRIHRPRFKVEAIHIRMENVSYATSTDYLHSFAEQLGVPMHIVTTGFDANREGKRKPVCFLCSWYRRKAMFDKAQELGCNKLALGHHKDDIVHTALMNLFSQGRFATMPVRLTMRKMPLTIIRPLCLESESDLRIFAKNRNYQRQEKLCPYETASSRTAMRWMFEEAERINPDAKSSVWNALEADGKLIE